MTIITKSALAAAILATCTTAAFADTGRPNDHVARVQPIAVDRSADDACARYQAVIDGATHAPIAYAAPVVDQDGIDSYATYLMVVDGMNRDAAIEHARRRRESLAMAGGRPPESPAR